MQYDLCSQDASQQYFQSSSLLSRDTCSRNKLSHSGQVIYKNYEMCYMDT